MNRNKVLSLLGIAQRGRNIVSGEFATEKAIKEGTAKLVIVAGDASDNTKKHFHDMCAYRELPIIELENKDDVGHAIGKQMRASLALTDEGIASAIMKLVNESAN
ncbi:MAG: ribosomal L7Ae/L30e/S12e/Gadd45 family protein [Lachnospiraceae bacterium]|nr:ribosomal L7Ae/L30e/S12e/Gadd45 family protein [Candidatus Merdinaster equi]